jgi:galactokinase
MEAILLVHRAERHGLEQRPEEALRTYETILERQQDPEIYRRAYVIAHEIGRENQAAELFAAAETAAERIAGTGEILALETQARLYADAGVKLEEAEKIALQNLEHKRDRSARETLAYVRERRADPVAARQERLQRLQDCLVALQAREWARARFA